MFRRRNSGPEPEQTDDHDDELSSPERVRALVFTVLEKRVGTDTATRMREDFDSHIADTPGSLGIEQAYVCLFGKLIQAMDRVMEFHTTGRIADDEPDPDTAAALAGFDHFR